MTIPRVKSVAGGARTPLTAMDAVEALPARHASSRDTYIGVDVGGTKIEAVATDDRGTVIAATRRTSPHGNEAVFHDIQAVIDQLLMQIRLQGLHTRGIGIGIPGQINPQTGDVANAVNLGIEGLHLQDRLAAAFPGVRIAVDNDVNAAALGAWTVLSQHDHDQSNHASETMAFLNFGTGLACGIVCDGALYHGFTGAAGEIGHLPIEAHHYPCKCGQAGCLETVASGSGVARLWHTDQGFPLDDLIHCSEEGNTQAKEVLEDVLNAMATAILVIAMSIDPARIVIGGGLAKVGEALLKRIIDTLNRRAQASPFLAGLHVSQRVMLTPANQPIGAIGAAAVSRHRS